MILKREGLKKYQRIVSMEIHGFLKMTSNLATGRYVIILGIYFAFQNFRSLRSMNLMMVHFIQ